MTSLPPHLEALGGDLERAARTRVAARRRRRRAQAIVLAAATVLVATGAGLGASGVDIVGWLKTEDPSSVRYLVDTTRTYSGPAPQQIECENVRASTFLCFEIPTAFSKSPSPAHIHAASCARRSASTGSGSAWRKHRPSSVATSSTRSNVLAATACRTDSRSG